PGSRRRSCPAFVAQALHRLGGRFEAVQRELAAGAGNGVIHALAQDDAAAVQLHLQQRALGQPEGVPDGLGQRDLAAFGHGRFHGWNLHLTVCGHDTYHFMHTQSVVPALSDNGPAKTVLSCQPANNDRLKPSAASPGGTSQRSPQCAIPSPPAAAWTSAASRTPMPACPGWASASTWPACPTR